MSNQPFDTLSFGRPTPTGVGDNEPYAMDEIDFTVPLHAFATRRRYVEIEIRQDLLSTPKDYLKWSGMLESQLTKARSATKQF